MYNLNRVQIKACCGIRPFPFKYYSRKTRRRLSNHWCKRHWITSQPEEDGFWMFLSFCYYCRKEIVQSCTSLVLVVDWAETPVRGTRYGTLILKLNLRRLSGYLVRLFWIASDTWLWDKQWLSRLALYLYRLGVGDLLYFRGNGGNRSSNCLCHRTRSISAWSVFVVFEHWTLHTARSISHPKQMFLVLLKHEEQTISTFLAILFEWRRLRMTFGSKV